MRLSVNPFERKRPKENDFLESQLSQSSISHGRPLLGNFINVQTSHFHSKKMFRSVTKVLARVRKVRWCFWRNVGFYLKRKGVLTPSKISDFIWKGGVFWRLLKAFRTVEKLHRQQYHQTYGKVLALILRKCCTLFKFHVQSVLNCLASPFDSYPRAGGGGYFGNFWLGMCRWDPGTLSLYQS